MSKFDYRQFKIGDVVEFSHYVLKRDTSFPPTELEFAHEQIGIICGVGIRRRGASRWRGPEEGCVFTSKGKGITCWKVQAGLLNKPYYVRARHITPTEDIQHTLPIMEKLQCTTLGGRRQL